MDLEVRLFFFLEIWKAYSSVVFSEAAWKVLIRICGVFFVCGVVLDFII